MYTILMKTFMLGLVRGFGKTLYLQLPYSVVIGQSLHFWYDLLSKLNVVVNPLLFSLLFLCFRFVIVFTYLLLSYWYCHWCCISWFIKLLFCVLLMSI